MVGHLIHGERTDWMPRLDLILDGDSSAVFEPWDRFAHRRLSAGRSMAELLATFSELRRGNLERLRALGLTDAELDRGARHPELGPVTARQLLATWVVHDLSHLAQIDRVLAHRYRHEVGPWRRYLRILGGRE